MAGQRGIEEDFLLPLAKQTQSPVGHYADALTLLTSHSAVEKRLQGGYRIYQRWLICPLPRALSVSRRNPAADCMPSQVRCMHPLDSAADTFPFHPDRYLDESSTAHARP